MDPFTYIPPTPITQPRYDAIRGAEVTASDAILAAVGQLGHAATYGAIGDATRAMHAMIGAACPQSADTSAAQRCVVIARMAGNEAATAAIVGDHEHQSDCIRQCLDNLRAARWQACRAIALCPESDLPPWQPTP